MTAKITHPLHLLEGHDPSVLSTPVKRLIDGFQEVLNDPNSATNQLQREIDKLRQDIDWSFRVD